MSHISHLARQTTRYLSIMQEPDQPSRVYHVKQYWYRSCDRQGAATANLL